MKLLPNNIYHGDCLDLMKYIPDKSIDITITDPPYGISFQSNHRKIKYNKIINDNQNKGMMDITFLEDIFRITSKAVYIFCRWESIKLFENITSVLVWIKNNWSMGDLKHEHGRQWEAIIFYAMQDHEFQKRLPDVFFSCRTGNELHPTQKPVSLIEKLITCNKGNLIFDPFSGSGTTAIACINTGRKYICIEKDKEYYDISCKRVEKYKRLLKHKKRFEEVYR